MPGKLNPRGRASTPPEVKSPPKKAAAKKPRKKKAEAAAPEETVTEAPKKGLDFIRNLHFVDVRVTLSHVNDERRIQLAPRGQRGDMERITDDEWDDPYMDRDLVERIPPEVAKEIITHQATNQQAPHPAFDALRNPLDQPYDQGVQIMTPYEQQGQVVAQIHQGPAVGRQDQTQTMVRGATGANPPVAAVPGSVQNPGPFPQQQPQPQPGVRYVAVPADVPPEQVADWLARQGGASEEAAAQAADTYRQSLRSSIEPTQSGG